MAEEEIRQEPEQPAAATEASRRRGQITMKVSEKGAVSVYGLGRFPVTLYKEQWLRLLDTAGQLRSFIDQNDHLLKKKEPA